ncbi:MAG: hypothetical protein ACTSVV_11300 [Promethearchaeota archaeon]
MYIVSDSSFFICFLDDIQAHQYLLSILEYDLFTFVIGVIIKQELKKSPNYCVIENKIENDFIHFSHYQLSEIIKPFFSEKEIEKGEHEVFAISFLMCDLKEKFITILDDDNARKFFINNLPECHKNLIGTVGFVEMCVVNHSIFNKEQGIEILILIRNSKFRINIDIINKIIKKLRES